MQIGSDIAADRPSMDPKRFDLRPNFAFSVRIRIGHFLAYTRVLMDPMAGSNDQSHRKEIPFPGFPGSRQRKAKSGFFPRLLTRNSFCRVFSFSVHFFLVLYLGILTRNFFYPVFGDMLLVLPMPAFNQAFFPSTVTRFFPCFLTSTMSYQ
jgi:hypothetical protein